MNTLNDLDIKFQPKSAKIKKCDGLELDIIDLFNEFVVSEFINEKDSIARIKQFIRAFLSNRIPLTRDDFNDDTFYHDCKIASPSFVLKDKPLYQGTVMYLTRFYSYLYSVNNEYFNKVDDVILNYNSIAKTINEGYSIINYNINNSVPRQDKWLFRYNDKIEKVDFTAINCINYRIYLKSYFWYDGKSSMSTKIGSIRYYTDFLNMPEIDLINNLTVHQALQFKKLVKSSTKSNKSQFVCLSCVKSFISFIEVEFDIKVNKYFYQSLKMLDVRSEPNTKYYNDEQIKLLISKMKDVVNLEPDKTKNLKNLLLIIVLYVLNTSMRSATILNLKIDDLHNSTDNSYFYIADSKTKENEKYNISDGIKKLHDEIIRITSEYRPAGNNDLFIYKRARGIGVAKIKQEYLIQFINEISEANNLPKLGISGLRNRFMNNITKKTDAGTDPILTTALTKHSVNVHFNSYLDNDISELCMEMYGVNIGNTPLVGIVTARPTVQVDVKNRVMEGCGHCIAPKCKVESNLDCLMCRYFACTPTNIPYFEDEINKLDIKISVEKIEHEKEFLITKKRLYVRYLTECYRVKNTVTEKNNTSEEALVL